MTRRPVLALDDPLASPPAVTPARDINPYEGAPTRQFNTRVLVPLHERYARLVRQLAEQGFATTTTEVLHALLHEGPASADAAMDLVRRWRAVRHGGIEP